MASAAFKYVPQPAATTFAFPSVFVLLLNFVCSRLIAKDMVKRGSGLTTFCHIADIQAIDMQFANCGKWLLRPSRVIC